MDAKVVAAKKRAKGAAQKLGQTLQKRVLSAIAEGGPANAVAACSTEAQVITRQVSEDTGVRLGRASLRLRNPANEGPAWVRAWLREQGERPARDVAPMLDVATASTGDVVRFIKPIPIAPLCLGCHGAADEIDPKVKVLLGDKYPRDAAVGYSDGALRGALWAETRVETQRP